MAAIAEQVGARYGRFELEEAALAVLEADDPPVTEITRRDVARCFDPPSLSGELPLLDLLRRIWPVDQMGDWFRLRCTLSEAVLQWMVRNDDWSTEQLFEELGALSGSRKRFFRLLEAVMHPLARRGPEQEEPEIGLQDAVNNDIVILSNAESCLVYDRRLPSTGLLWSHLVDWWRERHCDSEVSEEEARRGLGERLRLSLASNAERGLFKEYFRCFRQDLGDALPALIPQVYLHYDPAIVARLRHREALPRQRIPIAPSA